MCVESTIIQDNSDNSRPQGKPSCNFGPEDSKIEHEILGTRMNLGRWSSYQHRQFISCKFHLILVYRNHGNNWKAIARQIQTRTPQQVRSHAQKFQNKKIKKQEQEKDKHVGLQEFEEAPYTTTTRSKKRLRLSRKKTFKKVKEAQKQLEKKDQDNSQNKSQNKKDQMLNEIKITEIQFENKQIEPDKKNGFIEIPIAKNGLNSSKQDQQSRYLINIVKFGMQMHEQKSNPNEQEFYTRVSKLIFNWKSYPMEYQGTFEVMQQQNSSQVNSKSSKQVCGRQFINCSKQKYRKY